jgi:hypothetical protein
MWVYVILADLARYGDSGVCGLAGAAPHEKSKWGN